MTRERGASNTTYFDGIGDDDEFRVRRDGRQFGTNVVKDDAIAVDELIAGLLRALPDPGRDDDDFSLGGIPPCPLHHFGIG